MKYLPSSPTPPLAPRHLKIFTCCSLEHSITNRQGTLGAVLAVRRKKIFKRDYNHASACVSKQKGTEQSQKYSKQS